MGYTASASADALEETWYVVDARNRVLGQVASDIAFVLRGKHMTNFTPHANMRTHVIVLNADKVHLTGDKWTTKEYHDHSLWRGGLKTLSARQVNDRAPGDLVRRAVQGMLPKNSLGRNCLRRLRLFSGDEHPHQGQRPQPLPDRFKHKKAEA